MKKDYTIIILVFALVGVVSFSLAYIVVSQPKNDSTNNSLNSSNNSNTSTTVNQTSQVKNQTKNQIISEQQAIDIYTKDASDVGSNYRYVATLYYDQGKPYYSITIINKNNGESEESSAVVNAVTGQLEGPD